MNETASERVCTPPPPLSHPPEGVYEAVIVHVGKPTYRWKGRTVIRLVFQLYPPDGPCVVRWLNVDYRHKGSALRRVCALLVGSPNANFRALVNRRCLVEIKHRPGKKYPILLLPVRVGTADGESWVPLGYGFSETPSSESAPIGP
ncbi:MAG: hypothetical protein QXT77_04620 [Candidatus Methanomethylicaceae archaeon]